MPNQTTKQALRTAIRQKSIEIDEKTRGQASKAVCDHVLAFVDAQRGALRIECVIGFTSLRDEIDTSMFGAAFKERNLTYQVTPHSTTALGKDDLGWLPVLENNEGLVLIVPGLAFDLHGDRLGRGRAYYDHLLSTLRARSFEFVAIGVGYDHQVLDEVPKEPHDQPVNFVCTPSRGLISCLLPKVLKTGENGSDRS